MVAPKVAPAYGLAMDKAALQKRFGSAVRARRQALDFSQENFADSIGMHRAYYSAIERGERNLTLITMWRVAHGLGWTLGDLMKTASL